jgi:hypothetical protein
MNRAFTAIRGEPLQISAVGPIAAIQRQRSVRETDDSAGPDRETDAFQGGEMADVRRARRGGLLDFERVDDAVLNDEEVDFLLVLVPVVEERGLSPVVPVALRSRRRPTSRESLLTSHRLEASRPTSR